VAGERHRLLAQHASLVDDVELLLRFARADRVAALLARRQLPAVGSLRELLRDLGDARLVPRREITRADVAASASAAAARRKVEVERTRCMGDSGWPLLRRDPDILPEEVPEHHGDLAGGAVRGHLSSRASGAAT
jgi:hypothetical protein